MEKERNEAEILMEELGFEKKHFSAAYDDEEVAKADAFCEGYKKFLDEGKTERECVDFMIEKAKANGFTEFDSKKKYAAGDKVYVNIRNKSLIMAVMGKKGVSEGARIVAAHIDSPRLDLKPTPLYEDSELAYFKTHYYGGIKKYQWVTIPLALHGIVIKADGEAVKISIGEKADEPKFIINDILPHLGAEQSKRTLSDGIRGEELNILIGSRPLKCDGGANLVKLNVLKILNEKYGIREKDFISAELEAVPAYTACDIGFDRSLIGAYGHDDRVCAYPAVEAVIDCTLPERTTVTVLADKEEVGSDGNTGLNSAFLEYFIHDLAEMEGLKGRDVLRMSQCLSADVNAGFDPNFPTVHDKYNCCAVNYGAVITKYTGSRGKSGTSDASAEFMGTVRRILDNANVSWQIGELGKVDEGGGGTVAKYIANLGVDVVDLGVPVLSMHAPYETVAKADVYSTYRACYEFYCAE